MMKARVWARYVLLAAPLCMASLSLAQSDRTQQSATPHPSATAQGSEAAASAEAAAPAPPEHPATPEQIREYLSLTGIVAASHKSMQANVAEMQATAAPFYPADFWSDMKSSLQQMDLLAVYTPVLQRYVSQETMAGLLTFYRSPAGKMFLSVQPQMSGAAEAALRIKGSEVGQAVYARHKDEIDAAKKKYEAEHAGAAK